MLCAKTLRTSERIFDARRCLNQPHESSSRLQPHFSCLCREGQVGHESLAIDCRVPEGILEATGCDGLCSYTLKQCETCCFTWLGCLVDEPLMEPEGKPY